MNPLQNTPCSKPAVSSWAARLGWRRRSGARLALNPSLFGAEANLPSPQDDRLASLGEMLKLHHAPKAKRVIWLFMADGPSQLDLFDYKPKLDEYLRQGPARLASATGQRITTMTSGQARFPVAPSIFKFAQHGKHGAWVSELLPNMAAIADDICASSSRCNTEAINHDPAITFIQTGSQIPGRPSLGAWLSLRHRQPERGPAGVRRAALAHRQPARRRRPSSRGCGDAGFLPTKHQGVALRSVGRSRCCTSRTRRASTPKLAAQHARRPGRAQSASGWRKWAIRKSPPASPSTKWRSACRPSVPELTDISKEPQSTLDLYGPEVKDPGTFAYNCLLARRLAERGVRFTQVFLRGWDHHGSLPGEHPQLGQADGPAGRRP